jgi:hypothetical protein
MKATEEIWKTSVIPYIKALSELRQTLVYSENQKQDLWVLIRNANLLGYKFLSKYMTQDNYVKLVEFLPQFYETQGDFSLVDFIGFIRGASLHLEQLWTSYGSQDFVAFVEKDLTNNNTILEHPGDQTAGIFYPTSHYRLTYYLDQTGLLDSNVLQELFYNLAPIHYVLESVVAMILFNNEPYYMDMKASATITVGILVDKTLDSLQSSGQNLTYLNQPLQVLITV